MRVPLIWLKDYLDINESPREIAESFTTIGLMLDKPISNNTLDLEQRLNRSDLLSIYGCARDLAAFKQLKLKPLKTDIKPGKDLNPKDKVNIKVYSKKSVNRFNTRVFKNVQVKDSPSWLKKRLEQYGIPSKNNLVDITNFVMIELGQPMHAQDLAKFSKREIVIRKAKRGERITTLLGETITLDTQTDILAQHDEPIAIMGIVGGTKTAVTKDTTDIILDAGNYNHHLIRKSSRKLKILNETVSRYDKPLHPNLTQLALERATYLIQQLAKGEHYQNIDYYPKPMKPKSLKLRQSRVKMISGLDLKMSLIKRILTDLGFSITAEKNSVLTLEIPLHRTDIEVEDDLVSEVLRINNYSQIAHKQLVGAPPEDITEPIYVFEDKLRDILVSLKADEHITEPITTESKNDSQVKLENSLSSEKSALRQSISTTLSHVVPNYFKHSRHQALVFEIGKTYHHQHQRFTHQSFSERRELTVIYENQAINEKSTFIHLSRLLSTILKEVGIAQYSVTRTDDQLGNIYTNSTQIGELSLNYFTLYTQELLKLSKPTNNLSTSFITYSTEDISLEVSHDVSFGKIQSYISNFSKDIIAVEIVDERSDNHGILAKLTLSPQANLKKIKSQLLNKLNEKFNLAPKDAS